MFRIAKRKATCLYHCLSKMGITPLCMELSRVSSACTHNFRILQWLCGVLAFYYYHARIIGSEFRRQGDKRIPFALKLYVYSSVFINSHFICCPSFNSILRYKKMLMLQSDSLRYTQCLINILFFHEN